MAPKGRRYRCDPARNTELYAFEVSPNEQGRGNGINGSGAVSAGLRSPKWSARHVSDEPARHSPPNWLVSLDRPRRPALFPRMRPRAERGRPSKATGQRPNSAERGRLLQCSTHADIGVRAVGTSMECGFSPCAPLPDVSPSQGSNARQWTCPVAFSLVFKQTFAIYLVAEGDRKPRNRPRCSGQVAKAAYRIAIDTQWRRP